MKLKLLGFIVLLGLLLRLYNVGKIPVSLYWDEASLGYNAYSISQTLRDEHDEFLPSSRFIAFGDYKAPGYIYVDSLVIKIFGLSEWSVRLPSVISGTLLIVVAYFLIYELFPGIRRKDQIILSNLSAFIVAISPWGVQLSRGAFEANLATLLSGTGFLLLFRGFRLNSVKHLIPAGIFLALSIYTFNSHRIFVPLLLSLYLFAKITKLTYEKYFLHYSLSRPIIKGIIIAVLTFGILSLPLFPYLLSPEGKLRFNEVTWLNDLDLITISNQRSSIDGDNFISKIIHNRRVLYTQEFLKHYFDHIKPQFLFYSGDVNPRLSSQNAGEFYWIELPFLLIGLYFIVKVNKQGRGLIFSWLILAPIPAALARETPHALRALNILPIPQIVAAYGLFVFCSILIPKFKKGKLSIITLVALYVISLSLYLRGYYFGYAQKYVQDWQDGYKQMVEYIKTVNDKYDYIYITSDYGRPYIYVLFYDLVDPSFFWKTRVVNRDWYGFWYVYGFGKYSFVQPNKHGHWLIVDSVKNSDNSAIKIINDSNGSPVFKIYEKKL